VRRAHLRFTCRAACITFLLIGLASGPTVAAKALPPSTGVTVDLIPSAPTAGTDVAGGIRLVYIKGGRIASAFSGRAASVNALARRAMACGGINGGFFCPPSTRSPRNRMIGPVLTQNPKRYEPYDRSTLGHIQGRALVLWNERHLRIEPFEPWMGQAKTSISRLLPGATDIFLSGGWVVKRGVVVGEREVLASCVPDAMTCRRRSALAVTASGCPMLVVCSQPADALTFAKALAKLGATEAVLLDGGLSVELVWKGRSLVRAAGTKTPPPRLVPHAIVVLPVVQARRVHKIL
jgi:hypothetical protein